MIVVLLRRYRSRHETHKTTPSGFSLVANRLKVEYSQACVKNWLWVPTLHASPRLQNLGHLLAGYAVDRDLFVTGMIEGH
jgi:hypothetical protein